MARLANPGRRRTVRSRVRSAFRFDPTADDARNDAESCAEECNARDRTEYADGGGPRTAVTRGRSVEGEGSERLVPLVPHAARLCRFEQQRKRGHENERERERSPVPVPGAPGVRERLPIASQLPLDPLALRAPVLLLHRLLEGNPAGRRVRGR